jgi:hypothetical protein
MGRYLERPMRPDEPHDESLGRMVTFSAIVAARGPRWSAQTFVGAPANCLFCLTHDVWVSVIRCWSAISC